MKVQNIRIRDIENRWESISFSIQAIAQWAGVDVNIRSIDAALGLSFMISAPLDRKVSLSWWMTYGRDAFLIEGSKLFGMKIKPLSIQDNNAVHLVQPEAFEEFGKKTKPLIQDALKQNKPVLGWQGWPDYHGYLWGVITEESHDSELGFKGTTMWAHGKLLPLVSPPARLYVVEELSPRLPSGDELLRFSIPKIRKMVNNQIEPSFGIETGIRAYDRWLEWLAEDPAHHTNGDRSATCHYQMARFVTHNRESACRFIDHYKDGLHDDIRGYLEAMYADSQGVINALATSRVLKAVETLYRTEDGRESLAAGIKAAKDFLQAHIRTIDHLAAKMGLK